MSMTISPTQACPGAKAPGDVCVTAGSAFTVTVSADAIPLTNGYVGAQAFIQYGATGLTYKSATASWPDVSGATFLCSDNGTGVGCGALTGVISPPASFHKGDLFVFTFNCTTTPSQGHVLDLETLNGPNAGTSGNAYAEAGGPNIAAAGNTINLNCVTGVDDKMTSRGKFQILVSPEFRGLMADYPGYDGISKLNSPNLYDPNTVVGRSAYHLDGDATDSSGAAVGSAGTIVSDSDFSLLPTGFEGPAGTREVHTEIRELNLTVGSVAVRAGINAPDQPMSPGEVESKSASGNPVDDFPADSFFNVFVEVDLPDVSALPPNFPIFPGATLYNSDPLLVVNTNVNILPPRVVYVHGNTSAVPVFFKSDNLPTWAAGDLFGWLVLAGHGAGFDDSDADKAEFEEIFTTVVEPTPAPIPDTDGGGAPDDLEIAKAADIGNAADDAAILALDNDGDGCTNGQELGADETLGGQRNPLYAWDVYDTNGDQVIDLLNDILGVILHYQPTAGGAPPYDAAFDRGPSIGPNAWNMTAPDGVIDLLNDILGVIQQHGLDCT